jgi:hypothetical protein
MKRLILAFRPLKPQIKVFAATIFATYYIKKQWRFIECKDKMETLENSEIYSLLDTESYLNVPLKSRIIYLYRGDQE